MKVKIIMLLTGMLLIHGVAVGLPAFPGAQGGGAAAVGGRGGAIFVVTNLKDSGTGSLRACVEASGPRTCVFRVGGTITLESSLDVTNPYLTVAGQTAPGGGILISGKEINDSVVIIGTDNVIWRYTKLRKGYTSGGLNKGSTLVVFGRDVMADHNSTSWNMDEGMGSWGWIKYPPKNITYSYNLVAEGLFRHSTGYITGSGYTDNADAQTNIDFHHNLTMNNTHRNPFLGNKTSRWVNNINYNQKTHGVQLLGGIHIDIIGNISKRGPMNIHYREIQALESNAGQPAATGLPSIYLSGNIGWNDTSYPFNQWNLARMVTSYNGNDAEVIPDDWKRTTSLPFDSGYFSIIAETITPLLPPNSYDYSLEKNLLPIVGASQRLDCDGSWVANRDSVDTRLIHQYMTDTGNRYIIESEEEVGGFPTIASGSVCADSDLDGIPDIWENARGLDRKNAADRNYIAPNGYTYLENYLNGK
jgi:pectate lyase